MNVSSSAGVVSLLARYSCVSDQDIDSLATHPDVAREVAICQTNFAVIDVSCVSSRLKTAADCVLLSYAASRGYQPSVHMLRLREDYKSLVGNTVIASNQFVSSCVQSIQLHRAALNMCRAGKVQQAASLIDNCCKVAEAMAIEAGKMCTQVEELSTQTKGVITESGKEESVWNEQLRRIDQEVDAYKVKKAGIEAKVRQLQIDISEARDDEEKLKNVTEFAAIAAPFLSGAVNWVNMGTSSRISTMNAELDNLKQEKERKLKELDSPDGCNIEEVQKRIAEIDSEMKAVTELHKRKMNILESLSHYCENVAAKQERQREMRRELELDYRRANEKLAEAIERLQQLASDEKNSAKTAAYSLKMATDHLNELSTIFKNVRIFWSGIAQKYRELSSQQSLLQLYAQEGMEELCVEELKISAYNWVALAQLNLNAKKKMFGVNQYVDQVFSTDVKIGDLSMINQLAEKIKIDLKQEERGLINLEGQRK